MNMPCRWILVGLLAFPLAACGDSSGGDDSSSDSAGTETETATDTATASTTASGSASASATDTDGTDSSDTDTDTGDTDTDTGETEGDTDGGDGSFEWTELGPSDDSLLIYLSSSEGDDSNDCMTEQTPCATLMHGESLLRDGFPDWLMLKRGDEWIGAFSDAWSFSWTKSGRAADEPMVLTSYGDSAQPRPLIKSGQEHGFHRYQGDIHDFALVDLHFKAHTKDPYSNEYVGPAAREFQSGFRWTGDGNIERILIEGNKFEFYGSNLAMHPSAMGTFYDVSIRGNVFYSAWTGSSADYSQGIFVDGIDGLLVEGNVFDRNGGLIGFTNDPNGMIPAGLTEEDVTVTWFNHQAYIQSNNRNVTVRNNVFANGDGMQLRPGGVAEDNLFTRNINAVTFGPATTPVAGGVSGAIRNNVFIEGTDFSPGSATPGPRANGIIIANINPMDGLEISGNIFTTDMSEAHYGRAVSANGQDCGSGNAYPCPVHNVLIDANLAYNWRGGIQLSGVLGAEIGDITVQNNTLQNPGDDQANLVGLNSGFDAGEYSFADNRYARGGNANWFNIGGMSHDFDGWVSATSEMGAQQGEQAFVEPDRTLGQYNGLQGGDATHDAFMVRAREQAKGNWDPAYEAVSVNQYLREGF